MNKELVEFVSKFWGIPPAKVKDRLGFDERHIKDFDSVRFYKFVASLEANFGIRIKDIDCLRTFGDLKRLIK